MLHFRDHHWLLVPGTSRFTAWIDPSDAKPEDQLHVKVCLMSTLAEIKSAVDALPRPEQEKLLQHLAHKLTGPSSGLQTASAEMQQRRRWLAELRQLREQNATAHAGAPLQEVMDELRGERA
ncbi:MAG TPA: hypothetical protein VIT91_02775 [Chthoniobacterales bacterium]